METSLRLIATLNRRELEHFLRNHVALPRIELQLKIGIKKISEEFALKKRNYAKNLLIYY